MRSLISKPGGAGMIVLLLVRASLSEPIATSEHVFDRIDTMFRVSVYRPGPPSETDNPIGTEASERVLTEYTYVFDIEVRDAEARLNEAKLRFELDPQAVITDAGSYLPYASIRLEPPDYLAFVFQKPLQFESGCSRHFFTSPMLPGPSAVMFNGSMPGIGISSSTWGPLGPVVAPRPERTIYVDPDAAGIGSGVSWFHAYRHLRDALLDAALRGGEIRLAQGVYRPDQDREHPDGTGDRRATFKLLSNMTIRGGYAGCGEPRPDARDSERYRTVLSGDLLGNDPAYVSPDRLLDEPTRADNTGTVVEAKDYYGTAVLDGVTVAHGRAEGARRNGGGGLYSEGSVTVTDCRFLQNAAKLAGGAVLCGGAPFKDAASPHFDHCLFADNGALDGSAFHAIDCNATLVNCTFTGNTAGSGSAVDYARCAPLVSGCILWGNRNAQGQSSSAQIRARAASYAARAEFCCIQDLDTDLEGFGTVAADPCFADPPAGDYHLRSQAGRWDEKVGAWVRDSVTSSCIDAGDPTGPVGAEPFPNGGIVNMGVYGGTARASKSYFGTPPCDTIFAGDVNGDCRVDWSDLCLMALHWYGAPADPAPPSSAEPTRRRR